MLFPIILFLMTLSPLYIPVAVTLVDVYSNWSKTRAGQLVGTHRPMVTPLPAAA